MYVEHSWGGEGRGFPSVHQNVDTNGGIIIQGLLPS